MVTFSNRSNTYHKSVKAKEMRPTAFDRRSAKVTKYT